MDDNGNSSAKGTEDLGIRVSQGGKTIDTIPVTEIGKYQDLLNTGVGTAYKYTDNVGKTKYAPTIADLPSKVSLDKKTGDIKISAPDGFLKSDYYKNQVKPTLEQYSQAYKLNPDYKFPVSGEEGAEEHDVDWYVNKLNEDIQKMVKAEYYRQEESQKAGTELSFDNLTTMNSAAVTYRDADGVEHKVTDNDRQAIPNIPEANFLKAALGDAWDEKTNTVDYKTLMAEGWNREKQSDENLTKLGDAVDDYFRRGNFEDANLYAQMYAFRNFKNQQAPVTGFWRGTQDIIDNIGYGAITGAAGMIVGAENVGEGLQNFAGTVGTNLGRLLRGEEMTDTPQTGGQTFVKDYLQPEYDKIVSEHNKKAQLLNPSGAAAFTVSSGLSAFIMQMATGNGLAKFATEAAVTGIVSAKTAHLLSGMKTADSVEKAAYSIYAGTNFIMDSLSTEQAAQATITAMNNLAAITEAVNTGAAASQVATVAINGTKFARWAIEMTSDAVVDCALGRPDVVRAILDGDDQEHKDMLLNELGMNVLFWTGARSVGKISQAVKKTNVGRALTVQGSAWANRISTRIGNATDKIKSFIFGEDWKEQLIAKRDAAKRMGKAKKTQRLTEKIHTLGAKEEVRNQQEILARMSIFDQSDDLMKNVEKMEEQILNIKKTQVFWDMKNVQRATSQMMQTLTNSDFDPEFKGSFDAYMNQLKDVISAENAAGFGKDLVKKQSLAGVGEKGIRILDQKTINYMEARIQLSYNRVYGEEKLDELNRFISTFEDAATPELKVATDALIEKYRDTYANLHRIGLDKDLGLNFYNANEIDELSNARGEGGEFIFGENGNLYAKTMRVSDFDDYEASISRGVVKNKSTVLSQAMETEVAGGDFVDPTYILMSEISDKSRIAVTQGNKNILSSLPGVNTEVTVGATATEAKRLYKTEGFADSVKAQKTPVVEGLETSTMLDKVSTKANLANIENFNMQFNPAGDEDLLGEIDKAFDGYLSGLKETKGGKNLLGKIAGHGGADKEFEYMGLFSLSGKNAEPLLNEIEESASRHFKTQLEGVKGLSKQQVNERATELAANVREAFRNRLDGRVADLAAELIENGSTIVDTNALYDNITDAMNAIEGAEAAKDVVKLYDVQGRETFVKMDPLLADIFNNRPIPADMTNFQKINSLWNRAFHLGTTGANLRSFMAQNVKDFGNAWVAGGADATIKHITRNLVDEFGENIVSQVEQFEPSVYGQLQRKAAESGEDIANLAVQRELSIGRALSPATTETEAYNFMVENRAARFGGAAGYYQKDGYQRVNDALSKVMEKMEAPNAARETFLRDLSYTNGFSDAIEAGNTIKDARISAQFLMNNATTNFGREMYHLNNLRKTVPYLGAAVNGTKSFWRLWSLDPIGVTGRLMGGIAFPVIYLTGQSLSTEENRRIWKNIPEYQKDGNLIFVTNGQIVSVPIPEEMGGLINPIRQFVEQLHGVDPASFQELMLNDLIGLQPFNLDGFVMYDRNRLLADPTIWDRIGTGVSKFAAQTMPPMLKSALIYITGKDPYTGKAVPRTRVAIDPETGEEVIMDYTSGSFAKMLGNLFGDAVSAPMAQILLNNMIGTAGTDVLNGLWGDGAKLFSGNFSELVNSPELLQNLSEQITAPFTVPKYSLANSQWTQAVSMLNEKKMEMLNSDGYKAAINGMKKATTEKEYQNFAKAKQDYVDEYYSAVKGVVDRLNQQYPQAFDSSKFASVISLMNLETDAYGNIFGDYGDNAYNDYLHEQIKTSGRNAAIATMAELGFVSTSASSIFGYYGTDKETGKAVLYFNDPVSILNMKYTYSGADEIHYGNIHKLINKNNLWDKKKDMKAQVDAIYGSKKKLSDSDYDKIDAIYVNWNAEVMKAVAPYVAKMTPEAAINNSKVLNELEGLIEVPGEVKKDAYGRYVTNKKLGEGSAKDAYIHNYIKKIFKVNDTSYIGGHDYSGRTSKGGKK